MCCSCGMVLVTTTASKHALLIRDTAGPEKIPWVKIAYVFVAPASISLKGKIASPAYVTIPLLIYICSDKGKTASCGYVIIPLLTYACSDNVILK